MEDDGRPTLMGTPAPESPPTQLDSVTVTSSQATAKWGIYATGTATSVLTVDSVVEVEYRAEWRTPDYPTEEGSFQTFNKVAVPFQIPVRVAKAGPAKDRKTFMDTLDRLADSLDLYDVVTPEKVYIGVNIERIGYHRSGQSGTELIIADVWLKEIRLGDAPDFSNTATQSGQDPVNNGTVQPQPATAAQKQALTGG